MLFARLALLSLLIFPLGCSEDTPEQELIYLLKKKYANLTINEAHKREVIKELQHYFSSHKLGDENFTEIQKLIHKLGDGHVVIESETTRKKTRFQSGLEFFTGSDLIKSCPQCSPALPEGKYRLLEINDLPLKDFLAAQSLSVSASTPWGQTYRIIRTLSENSGAPAYKIKLKNHKNREFTTTLNWKAIELTLPVCVSGDRLDETTYKLNILSLWCQDPHRPDESRKEVFSRFQQQLLQVTSEIKTSDFIVLDLRENGGGGELEEELVLNIFNQNPVFMYKYQYLNKWRSKKWAKNFLNFLPTFNEAQLLLSNPARRPQELVLANKMVTLISAGCFSSCEGVASALKNESRSTLIGERTHGGIGEPVFMPITNTHYFINIPISLVYQKNGELFEGVGVTPNTLLAQDPAQLEDTVLKAAQAQIGQ